MQLLVPPSLPSWRERLLADTGRKILNWKKTDAATPAVISDASNAPSSARTRMEN